MLEDRERSLQSRDNLWDRCCTLGTPDHQRRPESEKQGRCGSLWSSLDRDQPDILQCCKLPSGSVEFRFTFQMAFCYASPNSVAPVRFARAAHALEQD